MITLVLQGLVIGQEEFLQLLKQDGYQYDIITMARDNAGNNSNYSV
jgi:hypothetical protein